MAREKVVIQNERQQDVNPITVTSAIHADDAGNSPFVPRTDENGRVAIAPDGSLWYSKGDGSGSGGSIFVESVENGILKLGGSATVTDDGNGVVTIG